MFQHIPKGGKKGAAGHIEVLLKPGTVTERALLGALYEFSTLEAHAIEDDGTLSIIFGVKQ